MAEKASKIVVNRVQELLRDPSTSRMNFTFGAMNLTPQRMADVNQAITDKKITIWIDPRLGDAGYYKVSGDESNRLSLASESQADLVAQSVVIHECVHAAFDLNQLWATVVDFEAVAYVAQGIYLFEHGIRQLNWIKSVDSGGAANVDLLNLALKVAEALHYAEPLTCVQPLYDDLWEEIRDHPVYRQHAFEFIKGDG